MAAVHGLHNNVNSAFAPLTLFCVVSVQQQHAKIHLCPPAVPNTVQEWLPEDV